MAGVYFKAEDIAAVCSDLKTTNLSVDQLANKIKEKTGINECAKILDNFVDMTYEKAVYELSEYIKNNVPELGAVVKELDHRTDIVKEIDDRISKVTDLEKDMNNLYSDMEGLYRKINPTTIKNVSEEITSLKQTIESLGGLDIPNVQDVLKTLSTIDNGKISELVQMIDSYKYLLKDNNVLLEFKIKDVLKKFGIVEELKTGLENELNEFKSEVNYELANLKINIDNELANLKNKINRELSNLNYNLDLELINLRNDYISEINKLKNKTMSTIKMPTVLRDVDIDKDGYLDIEDEIVDVLDFMIPIYTYSKDGTIIIKCTVSPKLIDGKIKIVLTKEELERLNLTKGFVGYKTSIQILTNLKEN